MFEKWFPSYKKRWKSLAGVAPDLEEVELPWGRTGEVKNRAEAMGWAQGHVGNGQDRIWRPTGCGG